MFLMYHDLTFTLRCFVLFHMQIITLKSPFSCWDPLPHPQCCRTECYQKHSDELKNERKPFIQLSEHIACHLCATWAVPGRPTFTLCPCQPLDLALSSGAYAARGFRGECVRLGINQMFGLHLLLSLSLSDKTISILIDVPMGFGWTQLCRRPYPGNQFKAPTVKNGIMHHKCRAQANICQIQYLGMSQVYFQQICAVFAPLTVKQATALLNLALCFHYIKMLHSKGLYRGELLMNTADKDSGMYLLLSPYAHH